MIDPEVIDRVIHGADNAQLEGKTRYRYITFCINWHEMEGEQFLGTYAYQWACRFKRGDEYKCADPERTFYIPE